MLGKVNATKTPTDIARQGPSMTFLVEVGLEDLIKPRSKVEIGSKRTIRLMSPGSEEFRYLLTEEGQRRYTPFVFRARVDFTHQEYEEAAWFVLRPYFNHRAAAYAEHYSMVGACPYCLRGRKIQTPGYHVRYFFKKPIQFLASGEFVVDRDVARRLVRAKPQLTFMDPKSLERLSASDLDGSASTAGMLIVLADHASGANVANTAFRPDLHCPPECNAGHTLEPFEDGILKVDFPRDAQGICFSEQNFGYAGGVWASHPYAFMQGDLARELDTVLRQSRVIAEPVQCV